MKMCATCKELYPDGDGLAFCPRPLDPQNNAAVCNGKLRVVECLLCEDSGKVEVMGENGSCPRGCEKGDQQ